MLLAVWSAALSLAAVATVLTTAAMGAAWLRATFGRPEVGRARRPGGKTRPRSSGLGRGRSRAELEELERVWAGEQRGREEREDGRVWADVITIAAERPPPGGRPTVFVMVPGNPGEPDFYTAMMEELFEASGRRMDCVVVGHAGHSRRCANGGRVFGLDEQVAHKVAFVRGLLERRPGARLVLAGHSVGAHICLRVMDALGPAEVRRSVAHACLLFPTVAQIRDTPNGRSMSAMFRTGPRLAIAALAGALSALPERARRALVRLNVGAEHPEVVEAALHILDFWVVLNALHMAGTEMRDIRDLDDSHGAVLRRHLGLLTFYCSPVDDWVPLGHVEDWRSRHPGGRFIVCEEGLRHAFVIGGSRLVARKCWGWCEEAFGDNE